MDQNHRAKGQEGILDEEEEEGQGEAFTFVYTPVGSLSGCGSTGVYSRPHKETKHNVSVSGPVRHVTSCQVQSW